MGRAAAALARSAEQARPLPVALLGAAAGEGVTTCAALLAAELSGVLGLRVLLVDLAQGDRPLAAALDRLGLAAPVLAPEALARSDAPVALVAPGAQARPPALQAWFDRLLAAAQAAGFDVVLADAPPADAGLAGLLAARCCGRAIIVIRAANLPAEAIERLRQDLAQAGVDVVGAILNQRREVVPRWIERRLR